MKARTEPTSTSILKLTLATAALLATLSCSSTGTRRPEPPQAALEGCRTPSGGYSGMATHGHGSYLVVHDTKGHKDDPRLGLLEITPDDGTCYRPLDVADWKHPDGRSSDLESACALPGRSGELLVAESGSWKGRVGRVFHVRVAEGRAEVLEAYELPLFVDNSEDQEGDNFEGMVCVGLDRLDDDQVLVILGERGGSEAYETGLLRWGTLDLGRESLDWYEDGRATLPVTAPGSWPGRVSKRDISDLYADSGGALWAVASAEAGDNGPFRSVVYRLGKVTEDAGQPVELEQHPSAAWTVDGFKIEALAAPTERVKGSLLSVGSEDENLGGVWRALFPGSGT